MSDQFELQAEIRADLGKGASRRLRRLADRVPAIIYGGEKAPQPVTLAHNELSHALAEEAFYSHIITLDLGKAKEQVILKDLQRHPSKPVILHADFLRVSADQKLHTKVPLHFVNEETCVGVKQQGGAITHNMTDLDIQCLPADLPEYIEVDLAAVEVGQVVHISDLKLPKGVESVQLSHGADHDLPVATIIKGHAGAEVEEEDGEEGEGGEE